MPLTLGNGDQPSTAISAASNSTPVTSPTSGASRNAQAASSGGASSGWRRTATCVPRKVRAVTVQRSPSPAGTSRTPAGRTSRDRVPSGASGGTGTLPQG